MHVISQSKQIFTVLLENWAVFWLKSFIDNKNGGFHERLDSNARVLDLGYRRLLTQCRQIYVCSHAYILSDNRDFLAAAQQGYRLITGPYRAANGSGFHFSIDNNNAVCDATYDLYGHAFVIFALAYYYQASKDISVLAQAKRSLVFINTHFKIAAGLGYYEALDAKLQPLPRMRRQNPHMHLFEACVTMYKISQAPEFLATADTILSLLLERFVNYNTFTLTEFFDDYLQPDIKSGHIVEPGHHFEWVWLLHQRLTLNHLDHAKAEIIDLMHKLFDWARVHGIDSKYAGIFNELDTKGQLVNANKRIWVVMEAIKAYSVMLHYKSDMHQVLLLELSNLYDILLQYYIKPNGAWHEICSREFSPETDYMPGSSTYHIFSGIVEAHYLLDSWQTSTNL